MSQVQQVKDAIDIVEIIGERVDLKHTGRNWRGLCPFHSESSPSFFVNQELQRYKCFGCGESGDVFTFLEKYEGMTFGESLQQLAERAGVTLEEFRPSAEDQQREQLLTALDLAKEYYHYLLTEHAAGEVARQYLHERGIAKDSINLFQIGYSVDGWEGLLNFLHKKKKFPLAILEQAGLVIKNPRGRYYDRFRGRIMFPLKNHRGQVVGFSGRVLNPTAKEAKYINSPETQLYHKAEMLYGYSELLQFIRKANEVIVVEGEFDVISSSQAHVNNVAAIKGSAFTVAHAKLIKRVAERVLFALDMDSAGVEATKRAIPIAGEANLELRVVALPSDQDNAAKDPDELARTQPKIWREAAKHSISVYQFLLNAALKTHDPKTPEGKRKIVTELAPSFTQIAHEVEKDYYLKALAEALSVSVDVIKKDIRQFGSPSRPTKARTEDHKVSPKVLNRRENLERYLWYLFLNEPAQLGERITQLTEVTFSDKNLTSLFTEIKNAPAPFSLEKLSKTLPGDLQQLLFDLHVTADVPDNIDNIEEWQKAMKDLKKLSTQEKIAQITKELDTETDEQRQQELLAEVVKLRSGRS